MLHRTTTEIVRVVVSHSSGVPCLNRDLVVRCIRPEFKFQQYTFSTLNFGKNASVVKLKPTKAIVAATEEERKLRQELEEYKV